MIDLAALQHTGAWLISATLFIGFYFVFTDMTMNRMIKWNQHGESEAADSQEYFSFRKPEGTMSRWAQSIVRDAENNMLISANLLVFYETGHTNSTKSKAMCLQE